jgi:DNA-binding response OmpR family regulator
MTPVTAPLRVLIVEDDIELAMTFEEAVTGGGYVVHGQAKTSIDAARLASNADLAIVDIHLGDENGTDIGRMLSDRWMVTVLFVTASPEIVAKGFPGAVGVVAKPVSATDLVEALDYAAARRANQTPVPPPALIGFV